MSVDDAEAEARRKARKMKLDDAFQEYVRDLINSGDMEPGMLIGWVAGMAFTHFGEDGEDRDGIMTEDAPNMNVFLARGLVDATAERFGQTASGFYDESEAG